jgi:ribosomal protein S15P/S13E
MVTKAKRPRSAERRTLPPDAKSLADMIRAVHRHVLNRVAHLKREAHDIHARRGLQTLFEQRAAAWAKLVELDPMRAEAVRHELDLIVSHPEAT